MRAALAVASLRALLACPALAAALAATLAASAFAQPAPQIMSPTQRVNPPQNGATPAAPPDTGAPVPFVTRRAPGLSASPSDAPGYTAATCQQLPCPKALVAPSVPAR